MASWANSWTGTAIPASFQSPDVGFVITTITVYNNQPASISFSQYPVGSFPGSGQVVSPFYPQNVIAQGWRSFAFVTNGTPPLAGSTLTVVATDSPLGPNTLATFSPTVGNFIGPANFTGTVGVTGDLTVTGQMIATGPTGDLVLTDRDGIGGDTFALFVNNGFLILTSSLGGNTVLFDEAKNSFFQGRIEASATGASAKPLLNAVPLTAPNGSGTSGTGNKASTAISISTDVPASAVMVAVQVLFSSPTIGGQAIVGGTNPPNNSRVAVATWAVNQQNFNGGDLAIVTTPQQLYYTIGGLGGADAWTLSVVPTAYWEPS